MADDAELLKQTSCTFGQVNREPWGCCVFYYYLISFFAILILQRRAGRAERGRRDL